MSDDEDLPDWVKKVQARKRRSDRATLLADSWVSQLGAKGHYPGKPRFDKRVPPEFDVSGLQGEQDIEMIVWTAFRRSVRKGDTVRSFCVGLLGDASYRPLATPSRSNPLHASIFGAVDHRSDPVLARNWWENPLRVTLDVVAQNSAKQKGPSND